MRARRLIRAAFIMVAAATVGIAGVNTARSDAKPAAMAYLASNCDTPTTPFCNALMTPPPGWTGNVFTLSQTYPTTIPTDRQPWLQIDPRTNPNGYARAVLAYFYAGNIQPTIESSFNPALNHLRGWYNAPWQDVGTNGREFVHGLTRERVSLPGELASTQTSPWNNYAVGFYNAPGGYAIGTIWKNHGAPNVAAAAKMPEGSVAGKLLYTTASTTEVPYLAGSPTWQAYVYANVHDPNPTPTSPRAIVPVRLLQIDIAVKDRRAGPTGWFFGTFVYGGGPGHPPTGSGWQNVQPVGLMWGNDPGYTGSGPLKESILNPAVHMPHVGYQGRLNGPVDNPISACMSCHGTGQYKAVSSMIPSPVGNPRWFRNIASGATFDPGTISTDYSLQVQVGLVNFFLAKSLPGGTTPHDRTMKMLQFGKHDQRPPRDGGKVD